MKRLFVGVLCLAAWIGRSQPTNVPTIQTHAVMLRTNSMALVGYGTNIFWSNLALVRAAGIVAPTNTPSDGQVPVWTGNAARWANTASVGLGGLRTNAITTNSPSGMTNVVSHLARRALNDATVTNLEIYSPFLPVKAYWDDNIFTVQDNMSVLGWLSVADGIFGSGEYLTRLNATNLFGFVNRTNLGQFGNQNVGARFLRNDYTWQIISGGGDMLSANNLSDVANAGAARTNLGAHNAANLTEGKIPLARIGANTPSANYVLRATSETSASWVPLGAGSGDMLSANNLSDVANVGQARTNLGAHNAAHLTEGVVAAGRLATFNALTGSVIRAMPDTRAGASVAFGDSGVGPGLTLSGGNVLGTNLSTPGHVTIAAGSSPDGGPSTNAGNIYLEPGKALYSGGGALARAGTNVIGKNWGTLLTWNRFIGTNLFNNAVSIGGAPVNEYMLDVAGSARLSNATLRGVTRILEPFDAATATNLVYGPTVTGDDSIEVTVTTNAVNGQRNYEVGLASWIKTNVVGGAGWIPLQLVVSDVRRCDGYEYDNVVLEYTGSWGRWESVNSNYPVHIEIWCLAETCQWQLWVQCDSGANIYTNATFVNPYPEPQRPPEGYWNYSGEGLPPARVAWKREPSVQPIGGRVYELLKFQAGIIVSSNSWALFNPAVLAEGDVWLLSSNGILHAVHRYHGLLYTNRLVP